MKRALGVCYYPEHWDETVWHEDAARMAQSGITWVRIGEFAWSRIEPEPGKLEWDWLDRAVETLGKTPMTTGPWFERNMSREQVTATDSLSG